MPDLATAAIGASSALGVGGSLLSASAAGDAADASSDAAAASLAEQQRQFDALQGLLSPYAEAGSGGASSTPDSIIGFYEQYHGRKPFADTLEGWVNDINSGKRTLADVERLISSSPRGQEYALQGGDPNKTQGSLQAQQDILGLRGADNQQLAINGIENSPMFSSLYQQGENAILANGSATGGLRGGNTQGALAQFRPQLLNQLIQQQFSNLGGLTTIGQNSAAQTGVAGQNFADSASNIYSTNADAQGNAAMSQAASFNDGLGAITQGLGLYTGAF